MPRDTIDLFFGQGHLAVAPPEGSIVTVIRKGALTKLADGLAAIRQVFEVPIASPSPSASRQRPS